MAKQLPFPDFFSAWQFLLDHPMFRDEYRVGNFHACLDVDVVRVNPRTERIDRKRPERNTATRVWLECGAWVWPQELSEAEREMLPHGVPSHDPDLDCAGETFEEAVLALATKVFEKFGTKYPRQFPHKRIRTADTQRTLRPSKHPTSSARPRTARR